MTTWSVQSDNPIDDLDLSCEEEDVLDLMGTLTINGCLWRVSTG
jgi:hypothetical protein